MVSYRLIRYHDAFSRSIRQESSGGFSNTDQRILSRLGPRTQKVCWHYLGFVSVLFNITKLAILSFTFLLLNNSKLVILSFPFLLFNNTKLAILSFPSCQCNKTKFYIFATEMTKVVVFIKYFCFVKEICPAFLNTIGYLSGTTPFLDVEYLVFNKNIFFFFFS